MWPQSPCRPKMHRPCGFCILKPHHKTVTAGYLQVQNPLFVGVGDPKMQHCLYSKPKDMVFFFFNLIFRHTQFVHFAQAKKASQKAKVLLSKWEKIPGWGRHGILRPQDHQDQRTRHLLLGSLLIVTVGQSLECSLFHCLVSKDFPKIFQRF